MTAPINASMPTTDLRDAVRRDQTSADPGFGAPPWETADRGVGRVCLHHAVQGASADIVGSAGGGPHIP
jgi:hypothetical protein